MIVSETSLARAVKVFLREACIPRPGRWQGNWSVRLDGTFLKRVIVPAFLRALEEVEEVQLCHGFNIDNVLGETK